VIVSTLSRPASHLSHLQAPRRCKALAMGKPHMANVPPVVWCSLLAVLVIPPAQHLLTPDTSEHIAEASTKSQCRDAA